MPKFPEVDNNSVLNVGDVFVVVSRRSAREPDGGRFTYRRLDGCGRTFESDGNINIISAAAVIVRLRKSPGESVLRIIASGRYEARDVRKSVDAERPSIVPNSTGPAKNVSESSAGRGTVATRRLPEYRRAERAFRRETDDRFFFC